MWLSSCNPKFWLNTEDNASKESSLLFFCLHKCLHNSGIFTAPHFKHFCIGCHLLKWNAANHRHFRESCCDWGHSFRLHLDIGLYFTGWPSDVPSISYLIFLIKISWSFIFGPSCRTAAVTVNSSPTPCDYSPAPTQCTHCTQKIKMIPACLRDSKGPVMLQTQEQPFSRAGSGCTHIKVDQRQQRLHIAMGPRNSAGTRRSAQGRSAGSSTGGDLFLFGFCLPVLCVLWKSTGPCSSVP